MADERRTPPPTEEGWYALHDFRTVDWNAWQDAPQHEKERAIKEGRDFLETAATVDDDDGATALYAIAGHKADLLILHLRPTLAAIEHLERSFEQTALAGFTEQPTSYVSVTEASGYSQRARDYFEGELDEESGLARYIRSRLYPTVSDAEHICFYPMDKRRDPEYNWYDMPFDERAEHLDAHGEIGREYGGKVTQMITGSMGLDDYEWGVTLWADDLVDVKDLLYEMRFDPSTSKFAEFGQFYVGKRFPPSDLDAYLAGEAVPADREKEDAHAGGPPAHVANRSGSERQSDAATSDTDLQGELADLDVYAGKPHGEDVYALVLYSEADPDELFGEVDGLRSNFDHYDTHVKTAVYSPTVGEDDSETAIVSIWKTQSAADTAAGFLSELPGVVRHASDDGDGWGTMGMFYTVKEDYREEFVEKFETVGGVLVDMDGHVQSNLLANLEDEVDMFIDSRWESKDDAMAFFRSEAFSDTVDWGRDVLSDRPRHVFLA